MTPPSRSIWISLATASTRAKSNLRAARSREKTPTDSKSRSERGDRERYSMGETGKNFSAETRSNQRSHSGQTGEQVYAKARCRRALQVRYWPGPELAENSVAEIVSLRDTAGDGGLVAVDHV